MTPRDAYQGMRKLASFMTGRYTPQGLPEDTITRKIQSNEIPTPSDVRRFVGSDEIIIRSLYFTLAVLHDIRRREGGRPYFTHVYSVAIKPDYRSHDPDVPAGYTTTSFEKLLGLNHETREEFGRTPLGSHVVGATIKDFFGKDECFQVNSLTAEQKEVRKHLGGKRDQLERFINSGEFLGLQGNTPFEVVMRQIQKTAEEVLYGVTGNAGNPYLYLKEVDGQVRISRSPID